MANNNIIAFRTVNAPSTGGFIRNVWQNTTNGLAFNWDSTNGKYIRQATKDELDAVSATAGSAVSVISVGSGLTVSMSGTTATINVDPAVTASKTYVDNKLSILMGGVPAATLDTIKEIADQIQADEAGAAALAASHASLITTVGTKQDKLLSVVNVSSSSTLAITDEVVLVNSTAGAITITLPTPTSSVKCKINIKWVAGTNTVVLSSTSNIDGASTFVFANQMESVQLVSDGSTYWIVG